MQIKLNNIGKRFNNEWIFRGIDFEFKSQNSYVILGNNGSGKSTLMQVVAGMVIPSNGNIEYLLNSVKIREENIFKFLSFASPYLDLYEEFNLRESIEFQSNFKPFFDNLTVNEIIDIVGFKNVETKQLKYYSSGMKQRIRLALAILSKTPLLLLDEPASNLDNSSIFWYQNLISKFSENRIIIVCSNMQKYEYQFCNVELAIEKFKLS